jgi:hypothetical protein
MVDFIIDAYLDPAEVEEVLKKSLAAVDKDTIIRFRLNGRLKPELRTCLNTGWLRMRLPKTINFSIAKNLFNPHN